MTDILAEIYGTFGVEKQASAGDERPTLSDLALGLVLDSLDQDLEKEASTETLEKIAGLHSQVLNQLVQFDYAGRASAQQEFSNIEKMAAEGNVEPLVTFFSDLVDEESADQELTNGQQAILAELQRRLSA